MLLSLKCFMSLGKLLLCHSIFVMVIKLQGIYTSLITYYTITYAHIKLHSHINSLVAEICKFWLKKSGSISTNRK